MGVSWSNNNNENNNNRRRPNSLFQTQSPSQLISSYISDPNPPPPQQPNQPQIPYPTPQYQPQISYPTSHHPPNPYYYQQHYNNNNNCGYTGPVIGGSNYTPIIPSYYVPNNNGWPGIRPPPMSVPMPQPPYVNHQEAKKVRNDVNVHKDTISIHVDEKNPDYHLVSFTFDALVDGSITIFYFGKEGENCKFSPLYPEAHMPVRIPFQEGLGQKFCQPSGTGIDLGFFELDDLSKPSQTEDVFPLVIYVEAGLPTPSSDEPPISQPTSSQSTQAVLVKNNNGFFQAKVIRQILWVEGIRYELRDIYGISNSDETGFNDEEPEKDCVICMSEPKDTAVLPCRHMCMCSECAKELRLQTNKCPICRQPIEELIEIKVNKGAD